MRNESNEDANANPLEIEPWPQGRSRVEASWRFVVVLLCAVLVPVIVYLVPVNLIFSGSDFIEKCVLSLAISIALVGPLAPTAMITGSEPRMHPKTRTSLDNLVAAVRYYLAIWGILGGLLAALAVVDK